MTEQWLLYLIPYNLHESCFSSNWKWAFALPALAYKSVVEPLRIKAFLTLAIKQFKIVIS